MQTASVASSTRENSAQLRSASAAVVRAVPATLRPFPAPGTPVDAPNASGAHGRAQLRARGVRAVAGRRCSRGADGTATGDGVGRAAGAKTGEVLRPRPLQR